MRLNRKKPRFKNCHIVTDDVTESEKLIFSFAIKISYIGRNAKTEILEYLWDGNHYLPADMLKNAKFTPEKREIDFKIPDNIMNEIKCRAEKEENRFHKLLQKEKDKTMRHLSALATEKEKEGRVNEANRIRDEIERRKSASMPELKVKVEPVALLVINAPVEIHRTVLANKYLRIEKVWEFENLTGNTDLACEGCGRKADDLFLTVDGLACEQCYKECKECGKPMLHIHECRVCNAPLCDEHVHYCSTCKAELCKEHTAKCEFCSREMCPEHTHHCSVCGAPLCEYHAYSCVVCGREIGPKHTRICDSCGGNVCPEHIHKCVICGRNVCENCAIEIEGNWYCKDHLESGYGNKLILPEIRCKECGIAIAKDDALYCEVCNAPLCPAHAHSCSVCGATLCSKHVQTCSICGNEMCEEHSFISEISGDGYCEEHTSICKVCGRTVGVNEINEEGICSSCKSAGIISRREVPKEIFAKFPYTKRAREWKRSHGKNMAYVTKLKGITLSYRIVNGEIVEHRG